MNPVFLAISLPLCGAFFLQAIPRRSRLIASTALLGLTLIITLFIVSLVSRHHQLLFMRYLNPWLGLSFIADGLSVFMAFVSVFVAFLISIYSLEYMKHYENSGDFSFWMTLFVGSMLGLVFSANLILIFCFWEMTSVCSWRLISFYRKEKDILAADKAFLITFFGSSLMLIGIVLVYVNYGTLELTSLKGGIIKDSIALLILIGIISKSAQLPLQTWLPDAGVAPTPVTALLHAAVLVKIGVYLFGRIFALTFIESQIFINTAMAISVITLIVAAGCALVEKDIKRILAYSTISQLGYILLAFVLNTMISFKIALLYILAHSLAKAGLFLCAGIIEHKTGTKDINKLGGLAKKMPLTTVAYILCAFSIIGIPPFLGFWPKIMLILLYLKSGYVIVGSLAALGAVFTLFYLMRLFNRVFLGDIQQEVSEESGSPMLWVVLILGVLSLILGIWVTLPFNFIASLI